MRKCSTGSRVEVGLGAMEKAKCKGWWCLRWKENIGPRICRRFKWSTGPVG